MSVVSKNLVLWSLEREVCGADRQLAGRQAGRQAGQLGRREEGKWGERGKRERERCAKQASGRETIERERMLFMVSLLFSCAVSASDPAEPPAGDACAVPPASDASMGNSTHTADSTAAAPAVGDTPPATQMASSSPVSASSILNPQLMDTDSVRQAILGPLQEGQAGGVTDPDSTAPARPKKKKKKKRPKSAQTSSSSESAQISQPTTSQAEGRLEVTLTESLDAMSLAVADTSAAQSAPEAEKKKKKKKKKKKADSGSEVVGQDVQVMDCRTEVAGPGKVEGGGEAPQVPPEIARVQEALLKREKVSAEHHQHQHHQHSPHGQRVHSDTHSGKKKPHQKKNVVSVYFEKDSFRNSNTMGPHS